MRPGPELRGHRQRLAGLREQLLAAFVAFHVVATLLLALPASSRLGDRAVWQSRKNQLQFAGWAQLASQLGVARDGPELEQLLWRLTQSYLSVRRVIVAPFEVYQEYTGVRQRWLMFSNPQSHTVYVHLELRRGAAFEPLYVSRSSEFSWRRRQLDHHRVRKLLEGVARPTEQELWQEFGLWAARQAARDYPQALELRIWQERYAIPEPGRPNAPSPVLPEQVRRYDLRALP